ncbi:MAG: flagellar export chaperone FliS [Gammaproteobacteria bacterium]
MNALSNRAMNQYKQVGTQVGADSADPHQLIVMLFDGALERIAIARGAIERKNVEEKGQKIGRVIAIVDGLRASLDKERGGEIAENLDNLYDYMQRRLLEANLKNDLGILTEVADLLKEVRSAWVAIPYEMRQPTNG